MKSAIGCAGGAAMLALAGAVAVFGFAPTEVNVAPTATVLVDGREDFINGGAELPYQIAEVVNGGFYDTQYRAELPAGPDERHLTLRFPYARSFRRLIVLGSSEQSPCTLTLTGVDAARNLISLTAQPNWKAEAGVAPSLMVERTPPLVGIDVGMRGADRRLITCIHAFVEMPRWQAWVYAALLQHISPWIVGGVLAFSILGWGRVVLRTLQWELSEIERDALRLVAGLAVLGALGGFCLWMPSLLRSPAVQIALIVFTFAPVFWELPLRLAAARRHTTLLLGLLAFVLLAAEAADSAVVAGRRAKPMDHVMGLYVPKHLFNDSTPPFLMSLRPWLVASVVAPTVYLTSTYAYWFYLGIMAWLNALTLIAVAPWLARWGVPASRLAVVALLPAFLELHFPGQRPLTAGLVLLAVYWWTKPTESTSSRSVLLGGGVAGLAYLCHPGTLFVLPGAALLLLGWRRKSLVVALVALAIPTLLHVAWSGYLQRLHPTERNDLAYYPIMKSFNQAFPKEWGWREAVGSLSANDWKELGLNRVKQLRHYAWAENPWHTERGELFRPISLTTSVGVGGLLAILLVGWRVSDRGFSWLAVFAPLACLHLHIGQAFPQFHIVPWPFVALACVVAAAWGKLPGWLRWWIVVESALPLLWPFVVVEEQLLTPNGWFSYDVPSRFFVAALPLVGWLPLAARAMTDNDEDAAAR